MSIIQMMIYRQSSQAQRMLTFLQDSIHLKILITVEDTMKRKKNSQLKMIKVK